VQTVIGVRTYRREVTELEARKLLFITNRRVRAGNGCVTRDMLFISFGELALSLFNDISGIEIRFCLLLLVFIEF
jgi:hypothetical protein